MAPIHFVFLKIHSIVPAVSNLRVCIQTKNIVAERPAEKVLEVEARQRWWLELEFAIDLDMIVLKSLVSGSNMRFIEFRGSFYLEHPDIPNSAEFPDAYQRATSLLAQLNGASTILCPPFRGAHLRALIELSQSGIGKGGVIDPSITPPTQHEITTILTVLEGKSGQIAALLPIWHANDNVREAFFFLGVEGSAWAELYKVSEIVEAAGGRIDAMVRKRWCIKTDWNRFRQSANHQEAIGRFSSRLLKKA